MKKKTKEVEVVAEKSLRVNAEVVAKQLDKHDICNWIVIEGLKKFNEGGKLGKNMEYFLTHIGVLEYSK